MLCFWPNISSSLAQAHATADAAAQLIACQQEVGLANEFVFRHHRPMSQLTQHKRLWITGQACLRADSLAQ